MFAGLIWLSEEKMTGNSFDLENNIAVAEKEKCFWDRLQIWLLVSTEFKRIDFYFPWNR